MGTNVVTSQPALTTHVPSVSEQPPSYEEVISQQPRPSALNLAVNDNEETSPLKNEDTDAPQLDSEHEDKCVNCEEQQRRNIQTHSGCCFVCYKENASGWWMCCNMFSSCCICLAVCTETCFENCANCLHTCCESSNVCCSDDIAFCNCDCDCPD